MGRQGARGFARDTGDVPVGRAFLRIAAGLDRASGSGFGPAERAKTDQDIANLSRVAMNHCQAPVGQQYRIRGTHFGEAHEHHEPRHCIMPFLKKDYGLHACYLSDI